MVLEDLEPFLHLWRPAKLHLGGGKSTFLRLSGVGQSATVLTLDGSICTLPGATVKLWRDTVLA